MISTAVAGRQPARRGRVELSRADVRLRRPGRAEADHLREGSIAKNYTADWVRIGTVNGTFYGVFFKGANKSTVWYNVHAFEDAGIEPPATWEDLLADAETLKNSGVPAYSFGAADGWTLTDLFENIYLRTAGPEKYDQLTGTRSRGRTRR